MMTRSQLFREAHLLTRDVIMPGDSYAVTFGAALRHLIAMERQPKVDREEVAERLVRAINARDHDYQAKTWEKGGLVRVYVSGPPKSKRDWRRTDMGYAEIAEDGTIAGYWSSQPARLHAVCDAVAAA